MEDTSSFKADQCITPRAPKDKTCPYCGQSFTSSSLGRHLDLFIKEKNPKPPDGLHDVEAIRKLRGSITRRQPRGSLARRATSTPAGTPGASGAKKSPPSDLDSSHYRTPFASRDSTREDATTPAYPFVTPWEATGVINDIPKNDESSRADSDGPRNGPWSQGAPPVQQQQRVVSRQVQKAQFEMKQKVQDAIDTAKAAELALREVVGSWRAAKQHIDMHSMPFDFEPLALDFPALTLQCLDPPPTLFSSIQHPTTASWSIYPPGHQQFEALRTYFAEEFRKWKISCEVATTAIHEEIRYPPSQTVYKEDTGVAVAKALDVADGLEKRVNDHIQSTYAIWERLPAQRRHELWILELARSVGKKQQELDKLKQAQHDLRQENANLKSHVEHLNRLQQPREFKILTPSTIPLDKHVMTHMQEEAVIHGRRGLGLTVDDRHSDLGTLVGNAIERWKNVIVSTRSAGGGMNAQRPLDRPGPSPTSQPGPSSTGTAEGGDDTASMNNSTCSTQVPAQAPLHSHQRQHSQHSLQALQALQDSLQDSPPQTHQAAVSAGHDGTPLCLTTTSTPTDGQSQPAAPVSATPVSATPSAPPSVVTTNPEDEMSDQDADAEMEDDDDSLGFAAMNAASTGVGRPPQQPQPQQPQQPQLHQEPQLHHQEPPPGQHIPAMPAQPAGQLEVPRTRAAAQQRFAAMNGVPAGLDASHPDNGLHGGMILNRPAQNVNVGMSGNQHLGQRGMMPGAAHHQGRVDMGIVMQGVGEPMYTE